MADLRPLPIRGGLPDETLNHIVYLLNRGDQFAWILTCRHAYELWQPLLYASIDCTTLGRRSKEALARILLDRPDLRAAVCTLELDHCYGDFCWPGDPDIDAEVNLDQLSVYV